MALVLFSWANDRVPRFIPTPGSQVKSWKMKNKNPGLKKSWKNDSMPVRFGKVMEKRIIASEMMLRVVFDLCNEIKFSLRSF